MTSVDDDVPGDAELRRLYAGLARAEAPASAHVSEDDWVRFADGTMDLDARTRLVDHVAACAACAEVFRVVAEIQEGAPALAAAASPPALGVGPRPAGDTGTLAGERPRAKSPASRPWIWYGLAAAAAMAIAVGGTLWTTRDRGVDAAPDGNATRAVAKAESSASAPAAAAVAPAAGPRRWAALPVAPAVTLPAALALVVRGASQESQAFLAAFGPAITPYREGRYPEAAAALAGVTGAFPDVPEGWFYLGVSHLLSGDAAAAVAPLQRATTSSVVGGDASWLHAVALERAGRVDEATTALRALCAGTGPGRQRACDAEATGK